MDMQIKLPTRGNKRGEEMLTFANTLKALSEQIGFKVSARGWCYQLEGFGLITKAEFGKVENLINHECRQYGYLPIDFVAEEEARQFSGVETPTQATPLEYLKSFIQAPLICENWYTPDWWDGEEYYIQIVVEKIDLKTLFEPVCYEYHIPIATSRGWSSMLQRAEYSRRFKQAENKGLQCVLLYCGDHDPDGLRISDFLRKNLDDLRFIRWSDGIRGYDPDSLTIDRFGLNYDFIEANHLTWINNLITSSKKDLADPSHPNHYLPYVQDYLAEYGARKVEGNAIVVIPTEARALVRQVIEGYLGMDAPDRFQEKHDTIKEEIANFRQATKLDKAIGNALKLIEERE